MTNSNGESDKPRGPLALSETLTIETNEGTMLAFEVVGILQDAEEGASYAVLHHEEEGDDEFIVTDLDGNLLEDDTLAQQILDDFLAFADEDEGRVARNGETS
ncbi:MAG: hypothetical protein JO146_08110 [Candidatus Eremiobacteraeota bacterium]|nr:hypothetical protein [Candidatus Eremiobacteraeota bacterium]